MYVGADDARPVPKPQPGQKRCGEDQRHHGQKERAPAFKPWKRAGKRGGNRLHAELGFDCRDRHKQQPREEANRHAGCGEHAHRDQHGERRFLGGERFGRRRAHEGRVRELHHGCQGEQAPDHRSRAEQPMAGLEGRHEDHPLRREPVQRRDAGERQAGEQEDAEGDRHAAAESAKLVEHVGMARNHHRAGDEEQRVLEQHVVDEVHQAAGDAERRAERYRHAGRSRAGRPWSR